MAYKEDTYYIDRILHHGDGAAFAGLVNKHQTMTFNIALRVTKSREDAEEVAQDAFVKVYHSLSQFKGDSKFSTWLYRIVYNLALSRIRKKSLFDGSIDDSDYSETIGEPAFDALATLRKKEHREYIRTAMNGIDTGDQLLVNLYYMDDQSVDEIATVTSLSASNVKVRLFRARKKMHDILQHHLKSELHSIL